jgi:RNA processing factor Prp31
VCSSTRHGGWTNNQKIRIELNHKLIELKEPNESSPTTAKETKRKNTKIFQLKKKKREDTKKLFTPGRASLLFVWWWGDKIEEEENKSH